jgi:hypothetical protein
LRLLSTPLTIGNAAQSCLQRSNNNCPDMLRKRESGPLNSFGTHTRLDRPGASVDTGVVARSPPDRTRQLGVEQNEGRLKNLRHASPYMDAPTSSAPNEIVNEPAEFHPPLPLRDCDITYYCVSQPRTDLLNRYPQLTDPAGRNGVVIFTRPRTH